MQLTQPQVIVALGGLAWKAVVDQLRSRARDEGRLRTPNEVERAVEQTLRERLLPLFAIGVSDLVSHQRSGRAENGLSNEAEIGHGLANRSEGGTEWDTTTVRCGVAPTVSGASDLSQDSRGIPRTGVARTLPWWRLFDDSAARYGTRSFPLDLIRPS